MKMIFGDFEQAMKNVIDVNAMTSLINGKQRINNNKNTKTGTVLIL